MDPSKELDGLFQEIKKVDRLDKARKTSFAKLQQKMNKKKKIRLAPAFISVAMAAIVFFLAFTFFNGSSSSESESANGIAGIDKNEEAIRAVLEKEFTGPDEEYIRLLQRMFHQQKGDMTEEEYRAYQESPAVKDFIAYGEAKYASFFTENGFDAFVNSAQAFMFSGIEGDHEMSIGDMEITQNENNPDLYQFTVAIDVESGSGVKEQFAIEGDAIVPEEGKIGKFSLSSDATQVIEKISKDGHK